ncbi:GntR family transcriptional regulator [Actinacidiphila acididurans]|uniref:GntR family transcriptional regulator n=1 Tax=Actinacidiphila acididurans TaxID=2784346 RepID=A0ABS2U3T5_9ACTN|nr:GntR family transcriptional regulator [Actinacidiphila acididurans]MBM9510268.1 GntR family transcriptional regulator [Actinacidiphila acididurans]
MSTDHLTPADGPYPVAEAPPPSRPGTLPAVLPGGHPDAAAGRTGAAALAGGYPEPLWRQAKAALQHRIELGEVKPGSRLPPERELCRMLGISRVTLRKALTALVEEGVLRAAQGRGWYVAPAERKEWPNTLESFSETARRMGLVATSRILRRECAPASFDEAEEFQIAPGTPLYRLERVRMLDAVPIAVDHSLVPADIAVGFDEVDFTVRSLYETLSGLGHELAQADTTIEARPADAALAGHLAIAAGTPVLDMRQIVRDRAQRPLLSSSIRYAGDRYRLRTSFIRGAGG